MLFSYTVLTAASSLFPDGSSGNTLQFPLLHAHTHPALDHLTLVAMTATVRAELRCQCVSLMSPKACHPLPTHVVRLCLCV